MFEIKKTDGKARYGRLKIGRHTVETPVFMPCGTKGTVKALTHEQVRSLGFNLFLCNTYHLMLRPGENEIKKHGGLHKWINWDGLLLTDSGGFQVFSLGKLNRVTEKGVEFASYLDGTKRFLTPEEAIEIQFKLGADIIMAFDECAPGDSSKIYAKTAMERTHEWALRCVKAYERCKKKYRRSPLLFPIAQGVVYKDLRIESVKFMASLPLPGLAIGGLSVGESKKDMYSTLATISPFLPTEKPRYLMGVGSPEDIVEAVYWGIDMFDCVLPTRLARHGSFWTENGLHHLRNAEFKSGKKPLMKNCACVACSNHSAVYIRHLVIENEMTGTTLLTMHNLHFLKQLMVEIREAIKEKRYSAFRKKFHAKFKPKFKK